MMTIGDAWDELEGVAARIPLATPYEFRTAALLFGEVIVDALIPFDDRHVAWVRGELGRLCGVGRPVADGWRDSPERAEGGV